MEDALLGAGSVDEKERAGDSRVGMRAQTGVFCNKPLTKMWEFRR
jgi:hypothetical protein